MRYLAPCLMFLANDEAISILGLLILCIVFLFDVWRENNKRYQQEDEQW